MLSDDGDQNSHHLQDDVKDCQTLPAKKPVVALVTDREAVLNSARRFAGWLEKTGYASHDPYDVWGTRFPQDYYRFLTGEYPSLTNRLNTAQEREDAAAKLFTELSNAVATLFLPRSLRPYSQAEPNLHLFDQWAASIASSINQDRRAFKDRA